MLKSAPLGTYWQETPERSSFTRVRCISTGGHGATHLYGSWKKTRAYSVPDASIKKFLEKQRKSKTFDGAIVLKDNDGKAITELDEKDFNRENKLEHSYISSDSEEDEIKEAGKNKEARLLVCTLDTEQNEINSGEKTHSRTGSVEVITAKSTVNHHLENDLSQSCQGCGNWLEHSDMVVIFDKDMYHMRCFSCSRCGDSVNPTENFLVLEDGSPLCEECSPICHSCGEKIVCGHINVLNKDFHEDCLKCFICKKSFGSITKVYATGGEPCCAECITPVFNEAWSPRGSLRAPLSRSHGGSGGGGEREKKEGEDAAFSRTSAGSSPGGHHTLPTRLNNLSKAVNDLPNSSFHSLLRPSFSVPSCLNDSPNSTRRNKQMSLSSLKAILYDELGVSLLMNFCMERCTIELVVFWLDAEHFQHFDGNDDDIKLFAHHIMLKYVGYYAELPLNLPKEIETSIVAGMQEESCSQNLFNEAQEWVLRKMELEIQPDFLRSSDGQKYLEALVNRDINRRKKNRELKSQVVLPMKATVNSFDKRHMETKFYIYEVQVEMGDEKYMIYRRYSEFHSLHHALKVSMPEVKLIPIPKKIYFGRSQTKGVAHQRMKDLQSYLQGITSMTPEVSQSDILKRFLTQTPADKADETFNSRIRSHS